MGGTEAHGAIETPSPLGITPADAGEITESRLLSCSVITGNKLNDLPTPPQSVMPQCAEKSLTDLHEYFKSERARLRSDSLQREGEPPTVPVASLKGLYERLMRQLSAENLATNEVITNMKEYAKLFDEYLTLANLASGNLTILLNKMELTLYRTLRIISPLDISRLLENVRSSVNAEYLIKDNDIILLLGSTGAGKSTLMHFLAGSKMRMIEVRGTQCLEPEVVMEGLEDIAFSRSSRSETSGIRAVTIHSDDKEFVVCDTAGLGDTRGPEQDITNGIVMTKAIRSAKSVKLVIFITEGAISDRYSNLRRTLVPSITRLIPALSDHVCSVFYLFNKIIDRLEGLAEGLNEFSYNMEHAELADANFTAMITDLAHKSRKRTHCTIADMIGGSNAELLKGFDSVEAIRNPGDVFYDFAAPDSIRILTHQLDLHKTAIFQVRNDVWSGFHSLSCNISLKSNRLIISSHRRNCTRRALTDS